jgi:alpha-L-rhamnosidase
MPLWFDHLKVNLATTIEHPEPTRSDCHAWGAHPVFHYHASLLGVRPASAGIESVIVRPQLGGLKWAKGKTVHPRGLIETDFVAGANGVHGPVILPAGVSGTFVDGERKISLVGGINKL